MNRTTATLRKPATFPPHPDTRQSVEILEDEARSVLDAAITAAIALLEEHRSPRTLSVIAALEVGRRLVEALTIV